MRQKWLLFLPFLVVTACAGAFGPGAADYSYRVAGEYQLIRSSGHQISVRPLFGETTQYGGGTKTVYTDAIPPKVVKIAWDDRFVIAEQQGLKRRSPNDPNDTYEEPANVFFFWILDAKIKRSYGPFDEATFVAKKKELGVPESLKMQDPRSYVKE